MKIFVVPVEAGTDHLLCVDGSVDVLLEWPESSGTTEVETLTLPYVLGNETPVVSVRVRGQWQSLAAADGAPGHFHTTLSRSPRALALRLETRAGVAFLLPPLRLSAAAETVPTVHGWVTPVRDNPYRAPLYTWSEPSRGIALFVRHQSM